MANQKYNHNFNQSKLLLIHFFFFLSGLLCFTLFRWLFITLRLRLALQQEILILYDVGLFNQVFVVEDRIFVDWDLQ